MAARPWTFDDIPAKYRAGGGLWEAANAVIAGTNQVSSVPDTWGVRPMVQPTTANQPFLGARGGFPAIVWPDTNGNRFLAVGEAFQPRYVAAIMQFQTGAEATASSGITHLIGGNSDTNDTRVRIRQNASGVSAADGDNRIAKNGGQDFAGIVLPLPMSIVEINGTFGTSLWGMGRSSVAGRAWRGPIWTMLMLGEFPPLDLGQRIQGRLAWSHGLQASLPADHPYRDAEPMITPPATETAASGGAAAAAPRVGGSTAMVLPASGGARGAGLGATNLRLQAEGDGKVASAKAAGAAVLIIAPRRGASSRASRSCSIGSTGRSSTEGNCGNSFTGTI